MKLELEAPQSSRTLRDRMAAIIDELAELKSAAGCSTVPTTILAVTKSQPVAAILDAVDTGIEHIGENYYQEARLKFANLPPVRKHFLGHVQTNKAKGIVECFDVVQSVDRLEAGRALARAARDAGKALPILVQVNISPSERFGVPVECAERLASELRDEDGLHVQGVMAIGPLTQDKEERRRAFERAARVFERLGGRTLSLGMSADWREAVECGSTMIRLGTALFGARGQKGIAHG